jgi:sensor histidine kinase YesM
MERYGGNRPDTVWKESGFESLIRHKEMRGNYLWFRFPLHNSKSIRDTLYLFVKPDPIWLYTYKMDELGNITPVDTAGNWQDINKVKFNRFPSVAYLPLEPNESVTFIVKANILRYGYMNGVFSIYDLQQTYKEFYTQDQNAEFVRITHSISMGLITFAALFFFAYAIINQQRIYFYYFLYILSAWIFSLQHWAHLPFVSFGVFQSTIYLKHYTFEASTVWMYIFYILFVRDLLEIKKQNPRLAKMMIALCWAIFIYSILFMVLNISGINDPLSRQLYKWFRIITMPIYLWLLFYIIATIKSPVKKIFNLAASILLIGTIASVIVGVFFMRNITIGSVTIADGDILVIAVFLEVIVMAMTLAHYNAFVKQESQLNQERYIQQLEENKRLVQEEQLKLEKLVQAARESILEEQRTNERNRLAMVKANFENKLQTLRLQTLESQMDPHFIFNSISAFRDLVIKNSGERAITYINAFAILLRKTLTFSKLQSIDLWEELKLIEVYLEIESLRFSGDFEYKIQIDETIDPYSIQVPPRILQPLVENAIKHGLLPSNNMNKKLEIQVTAVNNFILISVMDNGIGYLNGLSSKSIHEPNQKSFGLDLVKERLSLFNQQFDEQINFRIEENTFSENILKTHAVLEISNCLT